MLFVSKKMICISVFTIFSSMLQGMEQDQLRRLLETFVNLNISNTRDQITVEMGAMAAAQGDIESLKNCINPKNVNQLTPDDITVFHHAIMFAYNCQDETKFIPIFDYLLSQNAEIEKKVVGGKSPPIIFATSLSCHKNYLRPLEFLLARKGINPFDSINKEVSPVDIAVVAITNKSPGAQALLQFFQNHAANLYQAVQCLDIQKVKQFASPENITNCTKSPLAKSFSHWVHGIPEGLTVIKILLSQGASAQQQIKDEIPGITLLHLSTSHALKTGNTEAIEVCLENDGNPQYKPFPMAPSAIDLVKVLSHFEPNNPNIPKVRSVLNTQM